jgi:CHAD domain-containing protein
MHVADASATEMPIRPDDAAAAMEASPALGESLCAYAGRELRHARQCLSWRQAWLHRGVHQGRKSLRRVRATLALAAAALGRSGQIVDAELQRINRSLSDLRDGHALVEAIERLAALEHSAEHAASLRRARAAATRRRVELGQHARADGARDDTDVVLRMLQAGIKALPWRSLHDADVLHALADSERRTESAGQRATRADEDDDWHRWRRRARRLSQQQRALERSPLSVRMAGDAFKKLAVLLGEVQDFSLLADHCGARSPFADADRRLLRELADAEVRRLRTRLHETIAPPAD